MYNLLLLKKY